MTVSDSTITTDPADLIGFDSLLSPGELELRGTVRRFVESEIKPNIARWYEDASFPLEIVPEMAKLGLLGMHLKGYGCAGRSAVEYGLGRRRTGGRRFRVFGPSSRCRGRWPCRPSTSTAPKNRNRSGCRQWPQAMPSAASA